MVKLANTYTANAVMDFTINTHDKIIINMVEFKDREHTVSVKHNIDVEDMAYVVWGVLTQPKFSYEEQKVNPYKADENGKYSVSKFSIRYDETKKNPWIITVENGIGDLIKRENGTIGYQNYERQRSVTMYLSQKEAVKIFYRAKSYVDHELETRNKLLWIDNEIKKDNKKPNREDRGGRER